MNICDANAFEVDGNHDATIKQFIIYIRIDDLILFTDYYFIIIIKNNSIRADKAHFKNVNYKQYLMILQQDSVKDLQEKHNNITNILQSNNLYLIYLF